MTQVPQRDFFNTPFELDDILTSWSLLLDYCSAYIKSVVDEENKEEASVGESPMCTACEMAVVWMQNQLKQQGTKEKVLAYVNQVIFHELNMLLFRGNIWCIMVDWITKFLCGSFVKAYQVPWENPSLTATVYPPCQMFHSPSEGKVLSWPLRRFVFDMPFLHMHLLIILFVLHQFHVFHSCSAGYNFLSGYRRFTHRSCLLIEMVSISK